MMVIAGVLCSAPNGDRAAERQVGLGQKNAKNQSAIAACSVMADIVETVQVYVS
tara:strand:- start:76 stop:237 length:162 start_codon:yes stop_codon:yes gene_type:complete